MPHIDTTIREGSSAFQEEDEWESHFFRHALNVLGGELPMPCMYQGKPHFRGDLKPFKTSKQPTDLSCWIVDLSLSTYKYVDITQAVSPTNREYENYFSTDVERFKYVLKCTDPEDLDNYMCTVIPRGPSSVAKSIKKMK